jgi:hypothetical protein
LARPSTPSSAGEKGVDARIKSAQEDFWLVPASSQLVILAARAKSRRCAARLGSHRPDRQELS